MNGKSVDQWVEQMITDLRKSLYGWSENISQALSGADLGALDVFIETVMANQIAPLTTEENAGDQLGRLIKWRVKLLKVAVTTIHVTNLMMSIAQALAAIADAVADENFRETNIDYHTDTGSMAEDRFHPPNRPDGDDDDDRPNTSNGRQPRRF